MPLQLFCLLFGWQQLRWANTKWTFPWNVCWFYLSGGFLLIKIICLKKWIVFIVALELLELIVFWDLSEKWHIPHICQDDDFDIFLFIIFSCSPSLYAALVLYLALFLSSSHSPLSWPQLFSPFIGSFWPPFCLPVAKLRIRSSHQQLSSLSVAFWHWRWFFFG